MTEYYYSQNPSASHHEQEWTFDLLGNRFYFTTDNGVFSKNTVDFGSRTLLAAINQLDLTNVKKILDVGCGYGPLGLALAKKFPENQVDLIDINQRALELAKKNAALNQLTNVKIWFSDVYQQISDSDYDLIISNPPIRAGKKVVKKIITEAREHLNPNGKLIIVIQKKQGAPSAKKQLEAVYGRTQVLLRQKGYYVLLATR
ncbi:class I SAM-dependent methyltransferase [Liquorilactobacillus sicerae]|uniref:class I SAM-dependent methyltransferase n=1 Tax=Liquorilactobacillus sicerae TaxID=1416943 RepID=UPI00248080FC|nr:class I SAM-dependent methyltransferase [Liquorilactobacillus sicerae]